MLHNKKKTAYLQVNWQTAHQERLLLFVSLSSFYRHRSMIPCYIHVLMRSSSKKMSHSFYRRLSPHEWRRNYHKTLVSNNMHSSSRALKRLPLLTAFFILFSFHRILLSKEKEKNSLQCV